MKFFKSKSSIRLLFTLTALVFLAAVTAVVQADGPTPPGKPTGPPAREQMMGPPKMMGSCISGHVWYDGNHNGKKDDNEDPMDGATVYLFAHGHMGKSMMMGMRVTRDGGGYEFCPVSPGTYVVQVDPAEGHLKSSLVLTRGYNPTLPIMIEGGKSAMASFGFAPPRVLDQNAYLDWNKRTAPQNGVDG